jgi:hypothetical protein
LTSEWREEIRGVKGRGEDQTAAMQVAVGGVVGLGASEVLAMSFHPCRDELCLAVAGAHGYELIEADAISGHVIARTPLMRRLRHLWHQLSGTDAAVLILAYDGGDIEVWDSETRVQKDRMLPSKKDEGKAVTAVASGAAHTGAVIYYARGGSAIERAEVGTSKSLRYGRLLGRALCASGAEAQWVHADLTCARESLRGVALCGRRLLQSFVLHNLYSRLLL